MFGKKGNFENFLGNMESQTLLEASVVDQKVRKSKGLMECFYTTFYIRRYYVNPLAECMCSYLW